MQVECWALVPIECGNAKRGEASWMAALAASRFGIQPVPRPNTHTTLQRRRQILSAPGRVFRMTNGRNGNRYVEPFPCSPLFTNNLYQHTLASPPIEFAVEDLFPRTKVQAALRYGDYDLTVNDLSFVVGVCVVFASAVVVISLG